MIDVQAVGAGLFPATLGVDFTAPSVNSMTIIPVNLTPMPPGNVDVPVIGDEVVEMDETLNVVLSALNAQGRQISFAGGGATLTTPVTIVDDDTAYVSIVNLDATKNEGTGEGTTDFAFRVHVDKAVDVPFTVDVAAQNGAPPNGASAPGDFSNIWEQLPFDGNQGENETYTVDVTKDDIVEADESFSAIISGIHASGRAVLVDPVSPSAVGQIVNDDSAVITIDDASVVEGNAGQTDLVFTLHLSNNVDIPVSVDWYTEGTGAQQSVDFVPVYQASPGTATFDPDDQDPLTTTLIVKVFGDVLPEEDETLSVVLFNLQTGGRSVTVQDNLAVGTIDDDD